MSALKLAFLVRPIAYLMAAREVSIAVQTCWVPGGPMNRLGDLAHA